MRATRQKHSAMPPRDSGESSGTQVAAPPARVSPRRRAVFRLPVLADAGRGKLEPAYHLAMH